MKRESFRDRLKNLWDRGLAVVASYVAAGIARGRRPQEPSSEIGFTETTLLWDDDPDGGLASARVPLHPPNRSGSGSAALEEPTAEEPPRDIARR